MLNNLRRKRVQRLDINIYGQKDICWFKDAVVYGVQCANLGSQRYSMPMSKKLFEYYRPKLNLIPYYIVNNEIYNLIPCPSGSFRKGHKDQSDNLPQETKIEKSFLLGETEITQEIYESVMGVGQNPSKFKGNPKNPVENVSWYDALIFCNKLSDMFKFERYYTITKYGKIIDTIEKDKDYVVETNERSKGFRLPTEWEWEYAAKAGTQLLYSGSNNVDEVGWHENNSKVGGYSRTTRPMKKKKPNAWGFYDMSGNVWEWCENKNNSTSAYRVFRGGSWYDHPAHLCSAERRDYLPSDRGGFLGFRVCRYI